MKHGKGKYYYQRGQLYIGDWYQNKKHGKGQYFYENGTIYKGQFVDNKKHGKGRISEANGSYFQGTFKANNKDGPGKYYDSLKHKKYSLMYGNGKLLEQKDIPLDAADLSNLHQPYETGMSRMITDELRPEPDIFSLEAEVKYQSILHLQETYKSMSYAPQSEKKETESTIIMADNFLSKRLLSKRVNEWETAEVGQWLNEIGFNDCIEEFQTNGVTGDVLLTLSNDDLQELSIQALGDRKTLLREIQLLTIIFKTQCVGDTVAKYSEREITLQLINELNKENKDESNSSSSSSSQEQKPAEQEPRKKEKRVSMQWKFQRFLQRKGIKLTFLIPRDQIEILDPIGKGGYGQVFLGRWMGQEVAVKKYLKKQGFRNKHIGNFIEEVQVISKLQHPSIILYMGMCIEDNEYGMVTEFLSGGSLFDCLHKRKQTLTTDMILEMGKDIALGMAYLHEKDVLHCDLKSSNVLIDEDWNVKLCDFGLSRFKTTKHKCEKKVLRIGTPHWMAPQILRGEKYDYHSDVYSYGVLLWEMLTGCIPYKNHSTSQIIGLVGNDENHQLSPPQYPNTQLQNVFRLCTQRNPLLRPTFKQIVEQFQKKQ